MAVNAIDFFIFEDEETYHEQSKSGKVLSSHMLMDFINSPKLYQKKITGAISEKPRSAYTFGSAAHKLILEGTKEFDEKYIVSDGPVNPKTGENYGPTSKAFTQWKNSQIKNVISLSDYGELVKLRNAVQNNKNAIELLSSGVAEAVVRTDYCGITCQIRMDWFNPNYGIVDLKTTAELKWFENDAKKFGYIKHQAFYQAVLKKITGVEYPVHLIAVEKQEPYACGVWNIYQSALDNARNDNEYHIKRLIKCKETMSFPTGYENLRYLGE